MESLYTNVPIVDTINLIADCIYSCDNKPPIRNVAKSSAFVNKFCIKFNRVVLLAITYIWLIK